MRTRATAVIIKDGKILLMKRIKPGREYYIFPGGGVDEGETIEEAMIREVMEELSVKVLRHEHLFTLLNVPVPQYLTKHADHRNEYVYRVNDFEGIPELGGPEKAAMCETNQYYLEWIELEHLPQMNNVFAEDVKERVFRACR